MGAPVVVSFCLIAGMAGAEGATWSGFKSRVGTDGAFSLAAADHRHAHFAESLPIQSLARHEPARETGLVHVQGYPALQGRED